jgi:hypothetical protein
MSPHQGRFNKPENITRCQSPEREIRAVLRFVFLTGAER